ncbi:ABC transporter type 1, transmembrane domain-containing protein [Cercophora newfieldiana]|uniref:ABC transporter type 1, transmembrane domain-containing protein n=1 Tax=Cercophora newfieldiana TaxID=92897 RepID=A0AA39XVZ1_9PEZI|nr:ABC transporter type 1, transmembrane domain-containing protein [Cercophora newfieldiana]
MLSNAGSGIYWSSAVLDLSFFLCFFCRQGSLCRPPASNTTKWLARLKALLGVLLAAALQGYLVRYLQALDGPPDIAFTVALACSTPASLALAFLLSQEHQRLSRPSDLAVLYLLLSIICDGVALTVSSPVILSRQPLLVRLLGHLVLLLLEYLGPCAPPTPEDAKLSAEEQSTIVSRAFFGWVNPILAKGYKNILIHEDLPPLSRGMSPEAAREAMIQAWSQRAKPETKYSLPFALFKCLKQPFLGAIVPRLFVTLFRYSQPVLIKRSIRHVTAATARDNNNNNDNAAYWLVLSGIVVYAGLAISTGIYQHRLNRLTLLTRSALTGLIHHTTLDAPSSPSQGTETEAEAITLMSTDTPTLGSLPETLHETWAESLGVAIGTAQLAREIGPVFALPLFLILLSSRASAYVASHLHPRTKAWNAATQRRLAAVTSLLSSVKLVRVLGVQKFLVGRVGELRAEEISCAEGVRWVQVGYNASANALGLFAPGCTLVVFVLVATYAGGRGGGLDAERAFTVMAVLGVLTHPANMVLTYVPRAVAAMAGLERVQGFLMRGGGGRGDKRGVVGDGGSVKLRGVTLGARDPPLLKGVDVDIGRGKVVVVSGPVGAGKSTLLKAVLGEVAPVRGEIAVAEKRIGYCAQRVWLPGGSVRSVVCGGEMKKEEEEWYREVIEACCLGSEAEGWGEEDLAGGGRLSGGQRQRVALARAVFARCRIVLLDDVFSALDGETERRVFENLLGKEGLLRQLKTTVVLVSNSTQFFAAADYIIVLGDGGIKEQGTWDEIREKTAAIAKFIPSSSGQRENGVAQNSKLTGQLRARDEAEVDLARKTGDMALYGYYFRCVGYLNLAILTCFVVPHTFFVTIPQYWLELWTDSSGQDTAFYVCGILLLAFLSWTTTNGIMWSTLILLAPQSGLRLHQRLLDVVSGASLSFFAENDTGSILNRFSQDMQLIDNRLPMALHGVEVQLSKLFFQVCLLLVTQKFLGLLLPICALAVYLVQKVYLRTSRQLRFLELESRAAVFSSFLESTEGIETIRAFGWRPLAVRTNISRLANSQVPEFLLMALQRWLNIVLDLMAAGVSVGVIVLAAWLRDRVSGGQVGVALNIMLVVNSTLLKLVQTWTVLEVSLGAVARMRTLERTTEQEEEEEGEIVPGFEGGQGWLGEGRVSFKGVEVIYSGGTAALQDFTLDVEPGQRVVLCGRTGSGKSSVLLTLLRLTPLTSGTIELDGVDILTLPRNLLRERCFVAVPQDTLLLPRETLRFNLDPDHCAPDDVLIHTLQTANLWHHFHSSASNDASGNYHDNPTLDAPISTFPPFSAGQLQLFSLCRAVVKAEILRGGGSLPIVLLDEVTSALDAAAEDTVHRIIDEEFSGRGHTVIMVSHRIGGLFRGSRPERDVVVWMEDGRVREVVRGLAAAMWDGME